MVYVDPLMAWPWQRNWQYGYVSHMYADTSEELHAFAESIGLKRRWCSDVTQPNSKLLHYDLSPGKRKQAVAAGAVEKDQRHKFQFYPDKARKFLEDDDGGSSPEPEQSADSGGTVRRQGTRPDG